MGVKDNGKRVCSFYVSNWHYITMIIPYINEKIEKKEKIIILTQTECKSDINTFLTNLTLNDIKKNSIRDLNWNETKIENIENTIKDNIDTEKSNITIIIKGENEYIEKANDIIKSENQLLKNKYITIVNCYDVSEFNQNLGKILKQHDKILNTSGEKEINEVFEGVS